MEKFISKEIYIPNSDKIINELRLFVFENIDNYAEVFNHGLLENLLTSCPTINNWFKSNNLKPRVVAIIIIPPGAGPGGAHTDTQKNDLALNFGIENNEETFTAFYEIQSGTVIRKTLENGITWDNFENVVLKEVKRINLKNPTIINTKIPHSVHNPTDKNRISVSFRFVEDPWKLI